MREILFRGKRIGDGEWIEGNLFVPDEGHNAPTQICIGTNVIRITYDIDENTISEFTGLYDKNGTKIYEGDIVKAEVGLDEYKGIVKYNKERAMFFAVCFERDKRVHTDKPCLGCEYITQVIGNKWDNSELLEE